MMRVAPQWVVPDQLFDGVTLRDDVMVGLSHGKVVRVAAKSERTAEIACQDVPGLLSPGFVDLQVNGGGGVLFNQNPNSDGLRAILAAHHGLGTVRMLPTVITDAAEVLENAVGAVLDLKSEPGILGVHIEGPHISHTRRGTHAACHVRPMDRRTLDQVVRLRDQDVAVMITVAPEAVTTAQVAELAQMGCVVSIGHSDATAQDVRALLDAGARSFTHLFNAMSPMLNRAPGVVGAAINSLAHTGIICDGHHVADEMVGLAVRGRPVADRVFLVSDAMPTVGGPDSFNLYDGKITLSDGRLINSEGSLAGAHTTMFESVRRLVQTVGINKENALRMATGIPLALIQGTPDPAPFLVGMATRDLLVLEPDMSGFRHFSDV